MGRKDWLYWVGGSGGGRGKSSTTRRERSSGEMKEAVGCMCAVFQIFDLHNQFQLPLNQEESTTTSKGLEAPRNSLELDEPVLVKEQGTSDYFPVGMNKIKTCHERISSSSSPRISTTSCGGGSKSRIDDISSSEYSCSPGTKTPTLVARLMGLDLLPECTSSPSSSNYPQRKDRFLFDNINVGARSLPETPRVSASSARRSDVEHHRLSLQINNKENEKEEFGISAKMVGSRRGGRLMRQQSNYWSQDENRSPRDYAKQIVKQVKESVSKRVGLTDITNTNKNSREYYSRRDDNLVLLKPSERKKSISPSCSPRIRLLEANYKKKPVVTNSSTKSPRICETSCDIKNAKSELITIPLQEHRRRPKDIKKVIGSGKLPHQATDHAIRNKKKETSAKIKSSLAEKNKSINKTQLSATKLLNKQAHVPDALSSKRSARLSSNPSRSYNQVEKIFAAADNNNNGRPITPAAAAVEYKTYIQRILKRAGKVTSQIDPSIFHYLELFHPINGGAAVLSRRCNRKLIFQLVDELLSGIRRPHYGFRTWVCPNFDLPVADELCKKILSFPAAKCTVLEDIDGLIAFDLSNGKGIGYLEEEVEAIVCEIEGDLVAALVRDTAAMYGGDKG